jgi:precorrin-4 methylase
MFSVPVLFVFKSSWDDGIKIETKISSFFMIVQQQEYNNICHMMMDSSIEDRSYCHSCKERG